MGFAKAPTALLSRLLKSRQTLLFPATSTSYTNPFRVTISSLPSLKDPVPIGVDGGQRLVSHLLRLHIGQEA
jgi:hypothetical protein